MCTGSSKKYCSTEEAMKRLECSKSFLYNKKNQAMLGATKLGRIVKWDIECIDNYLKQNKVVFVSLEKQSKKSNKKIASKHQLW